MFYTTNVEDMRIIPSTNIGYLSHSTDEFIKKNLLAAGTLEKNDEYSYLGLLGYFIKAE